MTAMDGKTLVERVTAWLDGGCSSWNVPSSDIREMITRIEALEAENADLKRRLDNICMSIHTCSGKECERPICIANRKNKALEAALRIEIWNGLKRNGMSDDAATATVKARMAALEEQQP